MQEKHILGRVQITRECNQECVYCTAPSEAKELTFEEVKRKVIELKELGTTDLMLTGGEPTMRKDLIEILEFCNSVGFEELTIQTNGSNLDDFEFLKKIKNFKNIKFNMSFHTSDPELFGKISQKPENYQRVLRALEYIGQLKIYTFITTVISSLNYKKLKSFIMFMKQNFPHITHFSFNFIDPIYRAKENPWTVATFAETERYIHEMVDYMKKNNLTFRIEKLPLCYMAGFEEYCSDIRRGVFDENRMMSFLRTENDTYQDELMIEKDTKFSYTPQCKVCTLNRLCPGINPNYAEIHGYEEVFPVFEDPEKIIERVRGSRQTQDNSFEKRVLEDLKLFKYAIKTKSNKNNVYDTYSVFQMFPGGFKDEEFIYNAWKKHTEDLRQNKVPNFLNFYISIPYCVSNCGYCVYPSTTLQNEKQLVEYVEILKKDMKKFAPLFKGLKFKTLYIGGGTPSIFSEKQLDEMLKTLFSLYDFEELSEKAIEFNARNTTLNKIKVIEKYGFNKLSIGVQSLSPRVLEINKRGYQTKEMVKAAIDNFKKTNIGFMNVDLIIGLKDDTKEEFLKSFEELCEMGPPHICIYPIKTNDRYIKKHYGTFENFERFYYPLFDDIESNIVPIAKKYGYNPRFEVGKLSYIRPLLFYKVNHKTKEIKWSYAHFSINPVSNFCLGFYAHSRIHNFIDYRYIDKDNIDSMFLKKFSTNPEDYGYVIDYLSPTFEKVKFIVQEFYHDREIPREEYKKRYKKDIIEDFPYAIKALSLLKIITVTPKKIIFKQMNEKEAYPYLLFFPGRENVLKKTPI